MNPAVAQRGEQSANTSDVQRHGGHRTEPARCGYSGGETLELPAGRRHAVSQARMELMNQPSETTETGNQRHVVVVGPDGSPLGAARIPDGEGGQLGAGDLGDLVAQPAKVMRVGTMIKQLLDEVRAAPLDDATRNRRRDIHK